MNPYRLTLVILALVLVIVGLLMPAEFQLLAVSLLSVGGFAFVIWLAVGALRWQPSNSPPLLKTMGEAFQKGLRNE